MDLSNLPELSELTFGSRSLKELTLTKLSKVTKITCDGYGLNFLKVKSLPLLNYLRINNNNNFSSIKTLILDDLPKLKTFGYDRSDSTEVIEIKNLPELTELSFYYNKLLKTLKIEDLPKIKKFTCFDSPVLKSIEIITESILTNVSFYKIPSLQYICCSDINFQIIEDYLKINNIKNVYVTNFCSFDPFSDFGVVAGKVVIDVDNNGCDNNDKNSSTVKFDIVGPSNSGTFLISGNNKYDIPLYIGTNTVTPKIENSGFSISPEFITLDIRKNDTITQDFCITPKGIFRQTNITVIPLTPPARPGFVASYKIVWENVGNQIESGTLNFTYDETLLDYISATQTADQVADGIIKWNFSNLLPFEKREITVTLKVNRPTDTPAVNAGDKLYMTASILDNIFTLENTVVGSYDPNDKTCLQGDRVHPDMIGKYVDYLIRFENTGTYAAENVVVKDIIDTKRFDVSTLQITDASHEVYTRIEGNKVEFIFENIQLPFDDANNDGYIAFKIKTLSTLQLGDSLKNLADIYFDYNFPIRTNEAQTTVALPSFTLDWVSDINVYPNPVSDILHLQTEETWMKAEIFDVSGRIIRSASLSSQSIDVSTLESGTYFVRLRNGDRVGRVKFVKM
ncbi:MAG: T9SS type A sorting domain-containing protein [Saprospiraceae bacterium]|nr:T9SS type A sorting domain-containing protein [Saprospiraceae bacterium]